MRGHAAIRGVTWVGVCNYLMPLVFPVYNSAKIEDTEGKVRAGHLGRQIS